MKRKLLSVLCVLTVILLLQTVAMAAAWGSVQNQTAIVYLAGVTAEESLTCQVGNTPVDTGTATAVSALSAPMETIVAIDNSISIASDERPRVKEFLEDLIANRLSGEKFSILTISDEVNYLCENMEDYEQLKTVVQGLTWQDQNTQLTDGLYQVLDALHRSDAGVLRRIVLIADGVDNKQVGYTKEELDQLIRETGYPVYTIGCTDVYSSNNSEQLQNLFSLSRLTSGASFHLPEVQDTMTIVSQMADWGQGIRLEIPLPAEVCDGSSKVLQIVSSSGQQYTVQLNMPFATVVEEPEPEPEPAQEIVIPEPEDNTMKVTMIVLGIVFGVLLVVLVIFLLVRRNIDRKKFKSISDDVNVGSPDETTVISENSDSETQIDDGASDIWPSAPTLILRDVKNASRKYVIQLRGSGSVPLGRGNAAFQNAFHADNTTSHQQCEVFVRNGVVMVRNISVKNITKLDSMEIVRDSELVTGSVLKMGHLSLNVEIQSGDGSGAREETSIIL